ncbi:hypothetical protein H0H92_013195 [Tricholoma furcatifolium]|nr:hypothetical protein H0H92_013195 [Tricholoma furcatifolium]
MWRGGQEATTKPPLPSRKAPSNPRANPKGRKTQLEQVSEMTYSPLDGERITPLASPPWRRTIDYYGGRLKVVPAVKGVSKDEAAKTHATTANGLRYDNSSIIVYSDGSMLDDDANKDRKIVGWGLVAYHKGQEVFSQRGGLGHTAEVYDAEMTGLTAAARFATHYARSRHNVHNVYIYADNTAAVSSIYGPKDATPSWTKTLGETSQWNGARDTRTSKATREQTRKQKRGLEFGNPGT